MGLSRGLTDDDNNVFIVVVIVAVVAEVVGIGVSVTSTALQMSNRAMDDVTF